MQFVPYLFFDGDAREAFEFYAAATGGAITAMMPYAGTPAEAAGGADGGERILHVAIDLHGNRLMGSDVPPGQAQAPGGFAVALQVDGAATAERVFAALAEGGTVVAAIGPTFFAERYGMLRDRFGVTWLVNTDGPPPA